MKKKDKLVITDGPMNWEVLQQTNGTATIHAAGKWMEDEGDDTRLPQPFDSQKVCFRVVDEADGNFVTDLIPITTDGDTFQVTIEKVPVGGPYLLDVWMIDRSKNIAYPVKGERRRHICVGDVYLIAGQSNADGMGRGVLEEMPEIGIHVLRSLTEWDLATPPFNELDYARQSMFLRFAKKIRQASGSPVGLIPAAMGGAPLSRWLLNEDGDLYRKMVRAMGSNGVHIKAVLWYQGCTDAGDGRDPEEYLKRFESFVEQIRRDAADPTLPVYTYQLNRYKRKEPKGKIDISYSRIREAQRQAAERIPGVFVLPAIDAVHMSDFIHSSRISNAMLGERLAMQVLKEAYGIGPGVRVPVVGSAKLDNSRQAITIRFENVMEYLTPLNAKAEEFPIEVEDEDGLVALSDYEISGDTVIVKLARCCNGKTVIHGQTGTDPDNYLMDSGSQLPMLCFYQFPVEEPEEKN